MNVTMTVDKTVTLGDTEDISSFMEEVETYMTYKFVSYINQYWFPILVPIGFIGNILSFFVMMRPNNRKVSTCIYMAAISVNDNLMMCLALYNWIVNAVSPDEKHNNLYKQELWGCKIAAYLVNFCLQSSAYQVVVMAIDKYVAIKWPHRAVTYSTPKRAKMIIFIVFLCAVIYNSPHLLLASFLGGLCLSYAVGGTVAEVFSWTSFIVNGIIPFSLLIHMNYVIVQTIRKSWKMFRSNANATNKRESKMKNAENQLTIMLLLISTLFLILLLPTFIRFIYFSLVERNTPSKYASSVLFFQITYKLYTTNNGINFFLYCISGKKFRDDLKEMLCFSTQKPSTLPQYK